MEKIFKLKENGTTVRTEILAGLTTFMTMAYIIALNPNLLTGFAVGTPLWNGVFLATCIASAIGTACMAFLANKPFAMAPGMGLNSFFAVIAGNVAAMLNTDYTSAFQAVLCIILVEGIVFLLLSVFNIRDKIVHAIPLGVRLGIGPAIGLMLMNVGLGSNVGIYSENGGPFYMMRDFFGALTPSIIKGNMGSGYDAMVLTVVTAFLGVFVMVVLAKKGVKAAVLLGMLFSSVIYWAGSAIFLHVNPFASLATASFVPPFADMVSTTLFKFDFAGFVNIGWFTAITLVITFCMIDMFDTIGTLVGYTPYASLGSIEVHKAAMSVSDWHSKARKGSLPSMPSQGKVLTVDIPNAKSNFTARKAMIYLPPAALSDRPPALPVMELLAGQPGSPSRLIDAGNIAATMNAYAAKHDGLAPIVLVPDQNGEATHNSLCADTTQGNAETYLTTDVVNWAKKMLPVAKSARMWAMGGFSQGGTCTTQLVPRHPDIYGAMLPVDGELKPTNGSVGKMVQEYFAGDRKAYDEQVPVNAIAATGTPEQALFTGAGERDKESISNMRTIADAARKAGMEVTELIVTGTGHDWHAVQAVWRPGLDWFGERTGLGEMAKSLKEYPQVEVLQ